MQRCTILLVKTPIWSIYIFLCLRGHLYIYIHTDTVYIVHFSHLAQNPHPSLYPIPVPPPIDLRRQSDRKSWATTRASEHHPSNSGCLAAARLKVLQI